MLIHRSLALVLALAAACASTNSSDPPSNTAPSASATRELPAREKLPLAAREMLTMRMDRHGDRMVLLMESVVLLNYDLAKVLADELVAEPKLGRPARGERDTLNALLPPAFFNYQDQLAVRARTLASAAESRKHEQLMAAYVGVAETCVGCHAAYLYEDEEGPRDSEPMLHGVTPSSGDEGEGGAAAPEHD
jgi:hypothetical protein